MERGKKQLEDMADMIEQLLNLLKKLKGQTITIKEYLTTHESSYDRHFTSFSHFKLQLGSSGVRFSGARLWIEGTDGRQGNVFEETTGGRIVKPGACYEVSTLDLREIVFSGHAIILVEALSEQWTRKTEIVY